jgi:hypothetical protein
MYSAKTALKVLDALWDNHLILGQEVDVEMMPMETLDALIKRNPSAGPFLLRAWLSRQGFFISAWSLWEHFSRGLCESLRLKVKRGKSDDNLARGESCVAWVNRSFVRNGLTFADRDWFEAANCLRNIVAHDGTTAIKPKALRQLERSRNAFSDIRTDPDGYVLLQHCHVADLCFRIGEFIRDPARSNHDNS